MSREQDCSLETSWYNQTLRFLITFAVVLVNEY